jgi:hypothetical protein
VVEKEKEWDPSKATIQSEANEIQSEEINETDKGYRGAVTEKPSAFHRVETPS